MKKISLALLVICFSLTLTAQTNVSGGIYSNTTWTKANSPYIVTNNITVFQGVELTIAPGVVIKVDDDKKIEIRGKLIAVGLETDKIKFMSSTDSTVMQKWDGLVIHSSVGSISGQQILMEHVVGMNAKTFVDLNMAACGPYIFKHCLFNLNYQTNHDGGFPKTGFEDCQFSNNVTGLTFCSGDSYALNCRFENNQYGIEGGLKFIDSCYFAGHTQVALEPYGRTNACYLENNNVAVKSIFNSTNNEFTNNVIVNNNIGVEIGSYFNGSITFTKNTICNNSGYNIDMKTPNNANLADNCWCLNDSSAIRSKLEDGYKNPSDGLISFMPYSTNCPTTPLSTEKINSLDKIVPVSIFPNPVSNELYIQFESNKERGIEIYSMDGKTMLSKKSTSVNEQIELHFLLDGIYILQVKEGTVRKNLKFIKK
jgi:hypothetical protein